MDKAVVRRGVGAIVLALVAALLLGYLLKGKAPERKEVVDKQTMPTGIQMFPDSNEESASPSAGSGSGAGNTAAVGAIAAAGAAAASALASSGSSNEKEVRGSFNSAQERLVDANSGNAAMGKNRLVIDGAGQGIVDTANAGARETPAQFSIRAPKKDEVRPVVDRATSDRIVKSNPKLVGEKKLPPPARKIASSRDDNARKVASTKASSLPKKSSGRNKYSVQLLATSNLSKAKSLSNTMKKEGYDAYVKTSKTNTGNLYRVRLGNFSAREEAVKTQATLKRRYLQNAQVQSSYVVQN